MKAALTFLKLVMGTVWTAALIEITLRWGRQTAWLAYAGYMVAIVVVAGLTMMQLKVDEDAKGKA